MILDRLFYQWLTAKFLFSIHQIALEMKVSITLSITECIFIHFF